MFEGVICLAETTIQKVRLKETVGRGEVSVSILEVAAWQWLPFLGRFLFLRNIILYFLD